MSTAADQQALEEDLSTDDIKAEERLTSPAALRAMDANHVRDDADLSANRAAVQELIDFVPPFDQAAMDAARMGDRFNVNFGLGASLVNEAVGAYHDLYTSPMSLVKIALDSDVDPNRRLAWASIMSDEFTKMFRSWDGAGANMLLLANIFVIHGVAIPWFRDKSSLLFEVGGMEECKFPANTKAIASSVELMTIRLEADMPGLYARIAKTLEAGGELTEDMDGWNGPVLKWLIENSRPEGKTTESWNFEAVAREVKACRLSCNPSLPSVSLVWGFVKELDGSISVYATTREEVKDGSYQGQDSHPNNECWVYRKRSAFDDANQMFMIFAFCAGNKNVIHTIRGMGYAIYEAGQADNVLRCKMMDAARHRASEIYQAENVVDSVDDIQFIDLGHAMIMPRGLRGQPQSSMSRIDQTIGFALESNNRVLDRHGMGLANNSIADNPNARRNEMQVTVEMEHTNKMQGFAISLFYTPYDNLMRELVRRSFQESQTDLIAKRLVKVMKDACERRGVPKDIFSKIDLPATSATRLVGAGSKGSRILGYSQLAQMYSSMDAQGQEFFNYDLAAEIKGAEAAERYFGMPGERRGHVDVAIAQLENAELLEGNMIDPVDGENRMVHLREHLEELVAGIDEVNEGRADLAAWTLQHIPLYRHTTDTLEVTSVHPSMLGQFKTYRQQLQQIGEIIDNGLRHINKLREEEGAAAVGPDGQPVQPQPGAEGGQPALTQEQNAAQMDNQLRLSRVFAEGRAKIAIMQENAQAVRDIKRQDGLARIHMLDAETSARIRRQAILDKAGAGSE